MWENLGRNRSKQGKFRLTFCIIGYNCLNFVEFSLFNVAKSPNREKIGRTIDKLVLNWFFSGQNCAILVNNWVHFGKNLLKFGQV